jgi:hypothetical protein
MFCVNGGCGPCQRVLLLGTNFGVAPPLPAGLQQAVPSLCVDYLSANSMGTPTLGTLMAYQAILVYNDDGQPYFDATGVGNVVASYFDNGGRVVVALFADGGYALDGNWMTKKYNLIVPAFVGEIADSFSSGDPKQDVVPSSPVLAGVSAITSNATGSHGNLATANGGMPIANWASGDVLAVTGVITDGSMKQRKRVDLNLYPPDIATGVVTGDAYRLLANALLYQ